MKLNYWNKLSSILCWHQSRIGAWCMQPLSGSKVQSLGQAFKTAKCLTIKEKYTLSALYIKIDQMNKVYGK